MAGLNRMMRGRVLAERTDAVRGGKRRGSRKAPGPFGGVGSWWCAAAVAMMLGAVRRCRLVVVRGEILSAWAYVLRASLKTQFSSDFWDFVGFIPLAQGRLGR